MQKKDVSCTLECTGATNVIQITLEISMLANPLTQRRTRITNIPNIFFEKPHDIRFTLTQPAPPNTLPNTPTHPQEPCNPLPYPTTTPTTPLINFRPLAKFGQRTFVESCAISMVGVVDGLHCLEMYTLLEELSKGFMKALVGYWGCGGTCGEVV